MKKGEKVRKEAVVAKKITIWFSQHARILPWRVLMQKRNAYHVWVSEVMLQQTQVDTVRPYFVRWMQRFPNIDSLAKAEESEVLAFWQGLGYYTRARNLWKAAKIICEQHDGKIPTDLMAITALPGIGSYTGAAVLSFAYGATLPVIDGNVARVISRIYGIAYLPTTVIAKKMMSEHITAMHVSLAVDKRVGDGKNEQVRQQSSEQGNLQANFRAAYLNEGLIEFGALHCIAKKPNCQVCLIAKNCTAHAWGKTHLLPTKKNRRPLKKVITWVGVLQSSGRFLLRCRKQKMDKRMHGLWEFPALEHFAEKKMLSPVELLYLLGSKEEYSFLLAGEKERAEEMRGRKRSERRVEELLRDVSNKIRATTVLASFKHAYTSYQIEVHGWHILLRNRLGENSGRRFRGGRLSSGQWFTLVEMKKLPMAKQGDVIRSSLLSASS